MGLSPLTSGDVRSINSSTSSWPPCDSSSSNATEMSAPSSFRSSERKSPGKQLRLSGARSMMSRQAAIALGAWSRSYCRKPARKRPTGCRRNVNSTTTPKLPPPPRSAQKRSAFSPSDASTTCPSEVTTVAASRLSSVSPYAPIRWPIPPPSVSPATPVSPKVPPGVASPCRWQTGSKSSQRAPPWQVAIPASASTLTSRSKRRSTTRLPSPTQ